QGKEDSHQFDENLNGAVSIFKETVLFLDRLKPGVKDRFQIKGDSVEDRNEVIPLPVPLEVTGEATPPAKGPRRILY
ncbi:hypothetical protein HYS90_00780, partial [Candidatus Curtissbacteria bacterium]|nr:hypothetical protein [Candidatus Curtissbacteria bacterium]